MRRSWTEYGEILLESADRAAGYFTTRSESDPQLNARTSVSIGAPIQMMRAFWTEATNGDVRRSLQSG